MRCQVTGCVSKVVAKRMCDKHYRRVKQYGDVNGTARPSDWGKRRSHPLYDSWRWIRKRTGNGCVPRWDDFWKFAEDVSERPSGKHTLRRLDESKEWGPDNWFWKERTASTESRKKYIAEYRKKNPLAVKETELKRAYGITLDDYFDMLEKQGGKCAICGGDQIERYKYFSVDHCHTKGHIRGLLCDSCNRGLGFFRDNPDTLSKAIRYLNNG